MSKPINATPTVKGQWAKKFEANLKNSPSKENKEYLKRVKEVYRRIESNKD